MSETITSPKSSTAPAVLWVFRIVFSMAAVEAAIVFGFFIWGIADGSVSSYNIGLWLGILGMVGAVPAIGWLLRRHGKMFPAIVMLSLMALPGLLYVFFFVLVVASGTSWN